jgi:hypothetical protein
MLKEYPDILPEASGFSKKVKDISEFLAGTPIADRLRVPLQKRVGYDDPCHLIHGQGIKNQPRALLESDTRNRSGRGAGGRSMLRQRRHLQHCADRDLHVDSSMPKWSRSAAQESKCWLQGIPDACSSFDTAQSAQD